jgi:hypothetical protein
VARLKYAEGDLSFLLSYGRATRNGIAKWGLHINKQRNISLPNLSFQ